MPKLDPDDNSTLTAPIAPASTAPAFGFGSSTTVVTPPPATATPSFGFGGAATTPPVTNNSFGTTNNVIMTNQSQPIQPVGQNAFSAIMAEEASAPPEHWVKAFWRPAMGWLYMLICFADFVAFPLLSMFLPIIERGFGLNMGYTAWQSLTLSNGGLIHLAFGAILGVSAYGRTQEKKAGTS